MESDQPQNFNDRLSQWIAKQGFWFQLRYSMSSGGGFSMAAYQLLRMGVRLLMILGIVALGFAFYLSKRVESEGFSEDLRDKFISEMLASEAEIAGFQRIQGEGMARRFGAVGTSESFFQTLEAGNLSFKMGYFDGFAGDWDAGILKAAWLDAHVKAGANSSEEGAAAVDTLFKRRKGFDVLGLDISKAGVTWGYDERVGEISGSRLEANRINEGWRFNFKGGTFTQNWIRGFAIEDLVILLTPTQLIVEKGVFIAGEGRVLMEGVRIEGGELPSISGKLILMNVPLDRLLSLKVSERMTGSISGELRLSGSTNTVDGISMQGSVVLEGRDMIQIRDEFPLLEALDVVDVFNSYKRVVFNQGGFSLKTGGGSMLISDLELEARDFLTLRGGFGARYPTSDEVAEAIGGDSEDLIAPMVRGSDKKAKKDLSLKQAAELAKREEESGEAVPEEKVQFFAGLASIRDAEAVKREAAQRELNTLVFDGALQMLIPRDAFERSRVLSERYPVDEAIDRITIDIPLGGSFSELTLRQAERILDEGTADN